MGCTVMNIRNCLFTFLFFHLCILTFGQKINIGALAGINASQVSGDGYGGFNKAGILVGAYSNFDISEEFNFQFEINYSEKGSRRNPKTDEGDTEFFLLRMNYVEVPIMLRYKRERFTYEAGLYYGQLISSYLENENGQFNIPPQTNQLIDFDFGALIGINFNLTENIIMNWRYSNSILPVREYDSGANFWLDSGLLHHYISFSMRYEFIGQKSGT